MSNKSKFVSVLAVLVSAAAYAGHFTAARENADIPRLAFQVYAVRDMCEKDFPATLRAVKVLGYEGVETGRFYGRSAKEIRSLMEEIGLELVALQLYPDDLTEPKLRETLRFTKECGTDRINVAWFKGSSENRRDWQLLVNVVNHAAEVAAKEGITIGYHNHDQEFLIRFDGKYVWDWLWERLSPLVKQEFDPGWCALAGVDPHEVLKRYPNRNPTVHVMPAIADASGLVPGEAGIGSVRDKIDWRRLTAQLAADGTKWFVVKPVTHPGSVKDLESSRLYLTEKVLRADAPRVLDPRPRTFAAVYDETTGKYGTGQISLPGNVGKDTPVLLAIHGGGWSSGNLDTWKGVADFWRDRLGFAVFNIEYRLASKGNRWPACGDDCVAAARWILSPAFTKATGIKPDRIWICGGSAGGHLALWTLTHLPPEKVAGTVSISSIGDPSIDFMRHPGRYRKLFSGKISADGLRPMDPCDSIRAGMAPVLCTHAVGDKVVPIASHRAFADAYRAAGNVCEFFSYPCGIRKGLSGHCIWRPDADRPRILIPELENRIEEFVNKYSGFAENVIRSR